MKKLLTALTVTCLLAAFVVSAQDQPKRERGGPGGPGPGGRAIGMMGLPPQVMEKIGLTEEQRQKGAEVFQKYRPQLEELRKKMLDEFRTCLTDEQKKKFDDALEEMRQRFAQGRGAGKGAAKGGAKPDSEK